jgi:hypothetical protein
MSSLVRAAVVLALALVPARPDPFRIELTVVDEATKKPVACRFHVLDATGKPVKPPGLPFWRDHFVCAGSATLDLPTGEYSYEVERGPEWSRAPGTFNAAIQKREIVLKRIADLKVDGWWSGDLHIHRALEEAELHASAEDLHIAPVITWWNKTNLWASKPAPPELLRRTADGRFIFAMAGEDEREGGALLYFHLPKPVPITAASREHPSPMTFLEEARKTPGAHVDIEKPFWWDVPVWASIGKADTIGIANNHMCRSQMYENEAWGRPRDAKRLPAPRGNGFWTQEIYYHLLNCGLRIPPSAGSASGVLPNPVGYNRVYVHVGPELTWEKWWEGLRAGRSFVTNGPLLEVTANGRPPGSVFLETKELALKATVVSNDPVRAVEIVRDGKVERSVSPQDLGTLTFDRSGWFLVRCFAETDKTFRFASTAPFYVEIGDAKRRVSRASAKFFVDWVDERRGRIKETDEMKRAEVMRFHDEARAFWAALLEKADAD